MNSEKTSSPDDLRSMLADYLGGELDPRMRAKFERDMQHDPDFASEVASLQGALQALRSLDDEEKTTWTIQGQQQADVTSRPWGHTLRYAAMIGLAIVVGYVLRGMEVVPMSNENSGVGPPVEMQSDSHEDFSTRLARNYLAQPGRSGLGRSLIAYARTAQGAKKKN